MPAVSRDGASWASRHAVAVRGCEVELLPSLAVRGEKDQLQTTQPCTRQELPATTYGPNSHEKTRAEAAPMKPKNGAYAHRG